MTHKRKILVTGAAGYLGSRVIRDLGTNLSVGYQTIRLLDNLQRGGYGALMDLPDSVEYEFLEGDILDPASVKQALDGISAVIHLAAVVQTPFSFEHSTWTEQVNHWGTARLIEQCLDAGVQRFILASSASVYGSGGPFSEGDICRPMGPYAQSKYGAEHAVREAADRGLRPTVLRFSTIFGNAECVRFDSVANRFGYLTGIGRPLTVYGSGDQVRPLVHVRDASSAISFCLDNSAETTNEVFNVVGENASVRDLVGAVKKGRPNARVIFTEQDLRTRLALSLDGSRLERLGWRPRYTLAEGLGEIVRRFTGLVGPPSGRATDDALRTTLDLDR